MTDNAPEIPSVRRAGPDDLAAAMALVDAVWTSSNSEMLPPETVAALKQQNSIANVMASRSQDLWLAEIDGALAGVMGIDATGYLWACYVDPAFQRKGVASSLVDAAADHFRSKDLDSLTLDLIEGNDSATAFYQSKGWIERGRRPESLPGFDATVIRYDFSL